MHALPYGPPGVVLPLGGLSRTLQQPASSATCPALQVSLRGYAEVHAALAAMLWVERPALRQAAETQWEIAMEFNQRFADAEWVAATKHWPPRLMVALDRFLRLA